MFQKIITVFLYLNVDVGEGEMLGLVYFSAFSLTIFNIVLLQRSTVFNHQKAFHFSGKI